VNKLFYGDNLVVLRNREQFPDKCADLIYLDPPFNSNADYNVLFGGNGHSEAQIRAFDDTWHWGPESERCYADVMESGGRAADMLEAFYRGIGRNDMMAYLAMMAPRLIELHRVLKPTGSLYLHCDPTASHYLKLLLDQIFGPTMFRNEIVWKRTSAHSAAVRWNDVHDCLLFYTKSDRYCWNTIFTDYDRRYKARFKNVDPDGRRWYDDNLTAPGIRRGFSGMEWHGHNPTRDGNHWKISNEAVIELVGQQEAKRLNTIEKLDLLEENGLLYWSDGGGYPRFKRVLGSGLAPQDIISDIPPINSQAQERLGYPTQKPVALLQRVIRVSSNAGDLILDPFCGCGTTIHAAQILGRRWLGIDITHLAIGLIEYRLKDAFGINPDVIGASEDAAGAIDLWKRDPFQFEAWAVTRLLGIKPNERKTGDKGIDGIGRFYLGRDAGGRERYGRIYVSVKGGQNLAPTMLRDFRGAMEREKADLGVVHLPKETIARYDR
jgi:site-specific DNA-methyltransferase (adenine-specific)